MSSLGRQAQAYYALGYRSRSLRYVVEYRGQTPVLLPVAAALVLAFVAEPVGQRAQVVAEEVLQRAVEMGAGRARGQGVARVGIDLRRAFVPRCIRILIGCQSCPGLV